MTERAPWTIEHRAFCEEDAARALPPPELSTESRAALGQFSVQRLMAYGLTYADATQLRCRVSLGERWRDAALAQADDLRALVSRGASRESRINLLHRASGLYRMAQVMMIEDTDERRAIFAKASELFASAATLATTPTREVLQTAGGAVIAWRYQPVGPPVGSAIVVGGIEGWAMDFAELSHWLSRRSIDVWALDGPGQGESRLSHDHYLTADWRGTYRELVGLIKQRSGGLPLAFVGSSVGGTLALEVAACEPEVDVCCSNGGPTWGSTILGRQEAKVPKKQRMCGRDVTPEAADAIWAAIDLKRIGARISCPVLLIHGGRDPLISNEEMEALFNLLGSVDKTLIIFNDGDHCVYNHADDKHVAMADWVADRLFAAKSAAAT